MYADVPNPSGSFLNEEGSKHRSLADSGDNNACVIRNIIGGKAEITELSIEEQVMLCPLIRKSNDC